MTLCQSHLTKLHDDGIVDVLDVYEVKPRVGFASRHSDVAGALSVLHHRPQLLRDSGVSKKKFRQKKEKKIFEVYYVVFRDFRLMLPLY